MILLSGLLLTGCETLSYYTQSIAGHTGLMWARQPIDKIIAETDNEELQQKLTTAKAIRQFAITTLSLPDNGSYTSYVKLKRDPPIWNVIAAEEFSLKAKQWCYLVIGCASYRGYYHKENAEKYAKKMQEQGYEVYLASATAYSTLGWFADPLTSAMLRRSDAALAELIFHELAHQQLYIKDNSRFNEAFATTVGEEGAIVWLQTTGQTENLADYRQLLQVQDDFLALVNKAKKELNSIYASEGDVNAKRKQKAQVFQEMKAAHQRLIVEKWNNRHWYKRWFSEPINNAKLVAIATYQDLVPEFVALYERCGKDFGRFYRQVEQIGHGADQNINVDCEP